MPAIYVQLMQSSGYLNVTGQIETDAGKRPSVTNYSSNWYSGTYPSGSYNTAGPASTIRTFLNSARSNGCIPWLDWYSSNTTTDTAFSLKSIYMDGTHDAFLAQWATDMAAWGHPVFVRFDGEMNGSWRPSYYERNGFGAAGRQNAAGDFVLMWKHVVNIMRAHGAFNVTFGWCPNQQPTSPVVSYASIFPGRDWADWIGLDAYNWGGSKPGGGKTTTWATFTQILRGGVAGLGDSWAELTALDPNMPIFIGEHASDTREGTDTNASASTTAVWNGQKKADWLTDELNVQLPGKGVTDFRRIRMISYFNVTDDGTNVPVPGGFSANNGDWPIEDPTAASGKTGGGIPQAAWQAATGINSAYFVRGGQFTLPSGMHKVYPYEGVPQLCRFDNAVIATGQGKLQGFWKGSETAGTSAADSSGNARNGTYTGGFTLGQPRITVGIPDTDVLLNGTTGYINVANNASFWVPNTGKLSVAGIFQVVALPATGQGTVISVGGDGNGFGWSIRVYSTGALEAVQWNLAGQTLSNCLTSSGQIAAGTTYFFLWSQDQTQSGNHSGVGTSWGHLYYGAVGGTLVTNASAETTGFAAAATGTGTLNIGRRGDNTQFLNMIGARLAIWSDAESLVTATELMAMTTTRRLRVKPAVS
jgi:hypothetical protein